MGADTWVARGAMGSARGAGRVVLKSTRELDLMRRAGAIVAEALAAMAAGVAPGVTTAELDAIAAAVIARHDAVPSFTGVPANVEGAPDFPATITASINEEIVHGIPGSRRLREGDIISLDVGAIYDGYHGDAAITVAVGQGVASVDSTTQQLLEVTEEALYAGIEQAQPGNRLWDVIRAIQNRIEPHGFSIIREYQGHGIGQSMWEPPSVPNFLGYGRPLPKNYRLRPGMTLALEPMVAVGDWRTEIQADGWTIVTADRSLSAHFEHTIAITDDGPEILTGRD
jgi:methionyl aminopeptidase